MAMKRSTLYSILTLVAVIAVIASIPWVMDRWRHKEPMFKSVFAGNTDNAPKRVFQSTLAGSWYEADPKALAQEIQGYFKKVEGAPLDNVQALILPHAGYVYSAQTAAYGVKQVAGKTFSRVVVMGPSHRASMPNLACVTDSTHYGTPLGELPVDQGFVEALKKTPCFKVIPRAEQPEHSVHIQLPLLQQALGSFTLVPIVVGQIDVATARTMASALLNLIDEKTLVVASSDFTHFGPNYQYEPFNDNLEENIKKLDMGAVDKIVAKDLEGFDAYLDSTGATICGQSPIEILMAMLPKESQGKLLRYDTSGKMMGDFANSVSYCAIAFTGAWAKGAKVDEAAKPVEAPKEAELTADDKKALLDMARKTIQYVFDNKKAPTSEALGITVTPGMKPLRGAFVTLKKNGDLRGCIGDIFPERSLYEAVIGNAVNAAFRDYRFPQLAPDELPKVHIEISALTPPAPVKSYEDIVVGKHGVLLTKGSNRAVFLPQVAPEQGWDRDTMLNHLAMKAGMTPDAWREGAKFEVFEAIVFGEETP
ncbi:MAG TPA: AmmeMemoRadiSam system protein B [Candidatus Hydrogenedentes bacterium]|nr:AmmeMemoRadiSam system protein B [Candidatus Hydrogenedentota bacterium]